MGLGRSKNAARPLLFLLFAVLPAVSSVAWAAEYPRRIAIAPFTILGPQEQIRQTVDILPRLLSSRLMALAGAEVLLLPPGDRHPEEAARGAGLPLLLKGSVAKLGAGYSIDVTVTEPPTGKVAGAFFASAATEDEIIPRLADLAAEISEKLFGVKTSVRTYPPPAAAQPPGPSPAVTPPTAASAPPQATAQPAPDSVPVSAMPATPKEGWVPSSLKRISQSDKIADELYGVVSIDPDEEGNRVIVAWGKYALYFYRVKGEEILPFTRITKDVTHHFLNVEAIDVDGDQVKELLVTDLIGESLRSYVLKKSGDVYRETAMGIPYFLVVLPDWEGVPVVVGQRAGLDVPFSGKVHRMSWDGKTLTEGTALPADTTILPLSSGILGLSSGRFGTTSRLIYTDVSSRLRILDSGGKSDYKSNDKYGTGMDYFEWGLVNALEGKKPRYYIRKAPRVVNGRDGNPYLLIPEVEKGLLDITAGSFDSTRLVLLKWENGEFVEKAGTSKSKHFHSGMDLLAGPGIRKGGRLVASLVEQEGSALKDKISRLVLYGLE